MNIQIEQLKEQVKGRWAEFNDRQQKLLLIAAVVVGCLLYYSIIWEPIHQGVVRLRQDVRNDQSLLVWMQQAQMQLQHQASAIKKPLANSSNASLLALTENSLKQAQLSSDIKEIKQVSSTDVLVRFSTVRYENFLSWLNQFQLQSRASVDRVRMKRTDTDGTVEVDVTLTRG